MALFDAGRHQLAYVGVALVGDDGFGVVIHLVFAIADGLFDGVLNALGQIQLRLHLLVALKELDGVPARQMRLDDGAFVPAPVRVMVVYRLLPVLVGDEVFDVRKRVFHAAGEHVRRLAVAALAAQFRGLFRHFLAAHALERRGLHHFAAQRLAQFAQLDDVAVLARDVDHVQGDDHGDAQLRQLRGQVEVALDVRRVDDVEDGVRLLIDQIAARHHFLQRVGGKTVNARQVLNDYVVRALEAPFLFFNGDARPVAHELVQTRQVVEHGRLAAVRVARQGDLDGHSRVPSFKS